MSAAVCKQRKQMTMKKPPRKPPSTKLKDSSGTASKPWDLEDALEEQRIEWTRASPDYWNKLAELRESVEQLEQQQRSQHFRDRSLDGELKKAKSDLAQFEAADKVGARDDASTAGTGAKSRLSSRDLAECFDGIDGRDAATWRKLFSNRPKWIGKPAQKGVRGVHAHHWDPLEVAEALVAHMQVSRRPKPSLKYVETVVRQIRSRFAMNAILSPWSPDWLDYEQRHLDFEEGE